MRRKDAEGAYPSNIPLDMIAQTRYKVKAKNAKNPLKMPKNRVGNIEKPVSND